MKKSFLLLIIGMQMISINLFSQKKVEVGFYIGTSFTSQSGVDYLADALSDALSEQAGEDFPVSKSNLGFNFNGGGFLEYNFSPAIALKGGLEYATKGVNFNGELYLSSNINTMTSEVMTLNSSLNLTYLEFPISVQFSTRKKDKLDKLYFYLNLGVSPAKLLNSTNFVAVRMYERGFDNSGVTEDLISENLKSTEMKGVNGSDFAILGSLGLCQKAWFLDFKYVRGLKNIIEDPVEGENVKNNSLAIYLGYKF